MVDLYGRGRGGGDVGQLSVSVDRSAVDGDTRETMLAPRRESVLEQASHSSQPTEEQLICSPQRGQPNPAVVSNS
ncbi:MAG: hypothetical protein ACOCPT_02190 [Halanaeroarchaeum sp.]